VKGIAFVETNPQKSTSARREAVAGFHSAHEENWTGAGGEVNPLKSTWAFACVFPAPHGSNRAFGDICGATGE
jgi:hypothetical protein